jgi:hypothetical protein
VQAINFKEFGLWVAGARRISHRTRISAEGKLMEGELNAKLHLLALTKDELESFYPSPVPVLTRLETGSYVYKWTGYDLAHPKTGKITQYWLPWAGFKIGSRDVPGFKELRKRYRNIEGGVGRPQEFARARNAVTEQWNPMSSILKAELLKPVWGFVGLTGPQRSYKDPKHPTELANVTWIGGDYQLCIPNLTPAHIRKV